MSLDRKDLVVQGEAFESDDEEMPDEVGLVCWCFDNY